MSNTTSCKVICFVTLIFMLHLQMLLECPPCCLASANSRLSYFWHSYFFVLCFVVILYNVAQFFAIDSCPYALPPIWIARFVLMRHHCCVFVLRLLLIALWYLVHQHVVTYSILNSFIDIISKAVIKYLYEAGNSRVKSWQCLLMDKNPSHP